ncbi:hypothetical protein AVEN_93991-1 [Araneus ventricosus]|uniref:Uncharacterized protein n=1 Tax=Araneus ventricosus TaxID=182803 RepID=A0A4Y2CKX9_ARAVE|nr:hypothetical protein AVEN_93991-1 [Araneus ventricosus]
MKSKNRLIIFALSKENFLVAKISRAPQGGNGRSIDDTGRHLSIGPTPAKPASRQSLTDYVNEPVYVAAVSDLRKTDLYSSLLCWTHLDISRTRKDIVSRVRKWKKNRISFFLTVRQIFSMLLYFLSIGGRSKLSCVE